MTSTTRLSNASVSETTAHCPTLPEQATSGIPTVIASHDNVVARLIPPAVASLPMVNIKDAMDETVNLGLCDAPDRTWTTPRRKPVTLDGACSVVQIVKDLRR